MSTLPTFKPKGLLRDAGLLVAALVACACLAALAAGAGAAAVLAVVAGAVLAGGSVVVLAHGLAALLRAGVSGQGGNRFALLGFVLRNAGVAAATLLALRAGLPATWLLVGVTAWPLALAVAGFRTLSMATAERI